MGVTFDCYFYFFVNSTQWDIVLHQIAGINHLTGLEYFVFQEISIEERSGFKIVDGISGSLQIILYYMRLVCYNVHVIA